MRKQTALPYSEEAERGVLGGLLLEPALLADIRSRLAPEHFYLERHQAIYRAMVRLADRDVTPDLVTLQAEMELGGAWDASGGIAYLAELDLVLPDIGRLGVYAEIVRERSVRRDLIRIASETVRDAATSNRPVSELLTRIGTATEQMLTSAVPARWAPVRAAVDEILELVEGNRAADLQGLSTGFPDHDRLGPTLLKGGLYILAGRPGMGKSALALDVVRHLAVQRGLPVGIFSLEMRQPEIALRLLSAEADQAQRYLRAGNCSQNQWRRIFAAAQRLSAAPIDIDDTPDLTLQELEGRARRLKAARPALAAIVVDYLQLVTAGRMRQEEDLALISRRLKTAVAGALGVAVIALAQMNRENTRRSDPRPVLADLRGSGAIEQDADEVAFVHRPEAYEPEKEDLRGLAELIVAKHRHGATGVADLIWVSEVTSFRNRVAPEPAKGDPF